MAQSFSNGSARLPSRPPVRTRASGRLDVKGKGKGKAPAWGSTPPDHTNSQDEDDEASDDEAYVTSNDFGTPIGKANREGKGKGKDKVDCSSNHANANGNHGFRDEADGDDELYA